MPGLRGCGREGGSALQDLSCASPLIRLWRRHLPSLVQSRRHPVDGEVLRLISHPDRRTILATLLSELLVGCWLPK